MGNRSKKFAFVPFCLLAQAYQAKGIVKYEWKSSIKPFVELLIDNDINIIQMPCAESTFNNLLVREPKGLQSYDTPEFRNHAKLLAQEVSKQIKNIISSGYEVIAILGIEQSPSCCVNYIYTNNGTENRKGNRVARKAAQNGGKIRVLPLSASAFAFTPHGVCHPYYHQSALCAG